MEQETKKSRYIQVNPSIEEMGAAASVSPDKVKNTVSEIISELKMHLVSHEKLLREIDKTTIRGKNSLQNPPPKISGW